MTNIRREKTRRDFGFDTEKEKQRKRKYKEIAKEDLSKIQSRRERIENSKLYKILIGGAMGFDVLDGVLGILEIGGDILAAFIGLAYVYLSITVVRSCRLTFAVLCISIVDFLVGLIPVAGMIADFVFCGNYINRNMIKGFVEGDEKVVKRMNIITAVGSTLFLGLVLGTCCFFFL